MKRSEVDLLLASVPKDEAVIITDGESGKLIASRLPAVPIAAKLIVLNWQPEGKPAQSGNAI